VLYIGFPVIGVSFHETSMAKLANMIWLFSLPIEIRRVHLLLRFRLKTLSSEKWTLSLRREQFSKKNFSKITKTRFQGTCRFFFEEKENSKTRFFLVSLSFFLFFLREHASN